MGRIERLRSYEAVMSDAALRRRLDRIVGPTGEQVHHVLRRHWITLVGSVLLAVVVSGLMLAGPSPRLWLAATAASMTVLARFRHHWSDARTLAVAALWVVPMLLTLEVPTVLVRVVGLYAAFVYLLVTLLRWWFHALVLSDTSLWIVSGVVTTHSPRTPLSSILFQDVRQNLVEELLHCGTVHFDTAGTMDEPLAGFGPVDDPFEVAATIHKQRIKAAQRAYRMQREEPRD